MAITVRRLRADELTRYLAIVNSAIRGLAASHYPAEMLEAWTVPLDQATLERLERNDEQEIRLAAELDGELVGIAALVLARSELRACYVMPKAARRGCGSALVREIERLARLSGLTKLTLASSLNAAPFYAARGYRIRAHTTITLRSGARMSAVTMEKDL